MTARLHTVFTEYFTELDIQVKVIVKILPALELGRKCQRGMVGMIRDSTDHNGSFGVGLVVGLLGLSEGEPLRSRKGVGNKANAPVPEGQ